ncbi:tRNA (cytidine/uridine-2'-O-)-methyltransferase [Sporobacter termitidis DSM 10068]|uniref:Putative tRNA (cytidine(34)-2'-O)-methyltransferase n=1 Tax=Sporobacter termitidis DSM 10068 TaxID=1123282 RepID=A0A1M5XG21_9FIRM|nr:tRNA (cytidine(34)-2'-O)-methyltransferase [Sporobacter termitidis]SHH98726.1 tRNA (cytidine/uridine-2'-O-)-methyltransferase [Sporobacter termitidis DSM 10068]
MNIVLLEPEIPFNTGNVGRTCVAANASLHLIKPLGFTLDEKHIKRAGLDYWKDLDLHVYDSYRDFLEKNSFPRVIMATTKALKKYSDVAYTGGDFILFGKESAGIPESILKDNKDYCVRIPMFQDTRSLNLSNAVAIVLYEALRQQDFAGLEAKGALHHLSWG